MTKYVKLMPEYCATGVWNEDGSVMEIIPGSPALAAKIAAWNTEYDVDNLMYDGDHSFDIISHSAAGLKLALELKAELPDTTVIYFDESQLWQHKRSQPEYEINAATN